MYPGHVTPMNMKYGFNRTSGFREMFENVDDGPTDGQMTDALAILQAYL